jgi:hypothetical protein
MRQKIALGKKNYYPGQHQHENLLAYKTLHFYKAGFEKIEKRMGLLSLEMTLPCG